MAAGDRARQIQAVTEAGEQTWFIELSYEEGDLGHAVGSVYTRQTEGPDNGVPRQLLATNDSLSTIWASPSGAVRTSIPLIDLVRVGERVLFATGDGVAELFGDDVRMIKSNFQTATAWPGRTRVFFVEPAQPVPAFIEHDPANGSRPWFRRKHGA